MAGERSVYGLKPVLEALRAGRSHVAAVYLAHGLEGSLPRELRELAGKSGVPVHTLSRREIEQRCGSDHHQGALALVRSAPALDFDSLLQPAANDLLLLADGVQDPQNLGALMRTTEFCGGRCVVVPKHGASGLTPAAAKASAGASEHLPLLTVTNLSRALEQLKEAGYWCYAAVAEGGQSLFEVRFADPTALVVGSEGKGVRPLVASKCDALVSIPRFGRVESLNVANAAAVMLMEIRRQQAART